jgi:FKBP-type peptidyl-prolyl cis-trans isomerase SlyD
VDESAFVEVDRDQFGKEIPLEAGVELQVRTDDDNILPARIDKVTDTIVRLDLNHPLAGKELRFEVKVVGLREATAEELEHGHVHGADFNEEGFEDEFDDEFDEELEDDEDE